MSITPGTWYVKNQFDMVDATGQIIADFFPRDSDRDSREFAANAQAGSALPELIEAAKVFVNAWENKTWVGTGYAYDKTKAALQKAGVLE